LHWDAVCVSTESTENFVALDRCGIRHTLAGRADAGLLKQEVLSCERGVFCFITGRCIGIGFMKGEEYEEENRSHQ
jgi:hypothetical protein